SCLCHMLRSLATLSETIGEAYHKVILLRPDFLFPGGNHPCGVRSICKQRLGRFCRHRLTGMATEVGHDFSVHLVYLGQVATRHIAEVRRRFDLPHVRDYAAEESHTLLGTLQFLIVVNHWASSSLTSTILWAEFRLPRQQ